VKNTIQKITFIAALLSIVSFNIFLPQFALANSDLKSKIIQLTNIDRSQFDLPILKNNSELDHAAYLKAQDMINNDYFAHTSPQGKDSWYWFEKANYDYHYAGENLAINFNNANEVNNAWMNSPTHRENILNKNYSEIGIAIISGEFDKKDTTIIVQMFGKEFKTKTVVNKQKVINEKNIAGNEIKENKDISPQIQKIMKIVAYVNPFSLLFV